jgi:hypothetical protein
VHPKFKVTTCKLLVCPLSLYVKDVYGEERIGYCNVVVPRSFACNSIEFRLIAREIVSLLSSSFLSHLYCIGLSWLTDWIITLAKITNACSLWIIVPYQHHFLYHCVAFAKSTVTDCAVREFRVNI